MAGRRKIEIFSAGCALCESTVQKITDAACPSCDVAVLDMRSENVAQRAADFGITSIPAVVINGELADCCRRQGVDIAALRKAGLGRRLA